MSINSFKLIGDRLQTYMTELYVMVIFIVFNIGFVIIMKRGFKDLTIINLFQVQSDILYRQM